MSLPPACYVPHVKHRGTEHSLQSTVDALVSVPGVGPKVAGCIALFSLDKHDSIPVDVHVWALATRYA